MRAWSWGCCIMMREHAKPRVWQTITFMNPGIEQSLSCYSVHVLWQGKWELMLNVGNPYQSTWCSSVLLSKCRTAGELHHFALVRLHLTFSWRAIAFFPRRQAFFMGSVFYVDVADWRDGNDSKGMNVASWVAGSYTATPSEALWHCETLIFTLIIILFYAILVWRSVH